MRPGGRVQRVQPPWEAGAEGDGLAAQFLGDDGPLALRVARYIYPVAEGHGPHGEGLGQGGLAHANDSGEQDVRIREPVEAPVQRERVVRERRLRMDVTADVNALRAQAALGEKGIRTAGGGSRHAVGGEFETAAAGGERAGPASDRVGGPQLGGDARFGTAGLGAGGVASLVTGGGELVPGRAGSAAVGLAGDEQRAGAGAGAIACGH